VAAAIIACSALLISCHRSSDQASVRQPRSESPSSIAVTARQTQIPAQPRSFIGLPRCRCSQPRASYTGTNGIGGGVGLVYVVVTDVGRSACYLRETPQLIAHDTRGRLIHRRAPFPTQLPQDHGPKVALFPPTLASGRARVTRTVAAVLAEDHQPALPIADVVVSEYPVVATGGTVTALESDAPNRRGTVIAAKFLDEVLGSVSVREPSTAFQDRRAEPALTDEYTSRRFRGRAHDVVLGHDLRTSDTLRHRLRQHRMMSRRGQSHRRGTPTLSDLGLPEHSALTVEGRIERAAMVGSNLARRYRRERRLGSSPWANGLWLILAAIGAIIIATVTLSVVV
jgi:hypothetical protein